MKKVLCWLLVLTFVIFSAFAFAEYRQLSIPDLINEKSTATELPSSAIRHIDSDKTTVDCPHFVVKFRDSLYDGSNVILLYDVTPKDAGILLSDKEPTESWYALTHINQDRDALQAENKTILKQWDEGEYKAYYFVEADNVLDITGSEDIKQYGDGAGGILNTETGTFTGVIVVPFDQYKAERSLSFSVRMLPFTDIHKENSENYDLAEYASIELTLKASDTTGTVENSVTVSIIPDTDDNHGPFVMSDGLIPWGNGYISFVIMQSNGKDEVAGTITASISYYSQSGKTADEVKGWNVILNEHEDMPVYCERWFTFPDGGQTNYINTTFRVFADEMTQVCLEPVLADDLNTEDFPDIVGVLQK